MAEEEEGLIVDLIADIVELTGVLITALSILFFLYSAFTGGYIWTVMASLIGMVVGMAFWWSGRKLKEGSKAGLVPLLVTVLATTPVDISDPVTAALEILALLFLAYLHHKLDNKRG